MVRSLAEILEHSEEMAAELESDDIEIGDDAEASALSALQRAVVRRGEVEERISKAVAAAKLAGSTWAAIGGRLGTSGEAARQRYSHAVRAV